MLLYIHLPTEKKSLGNALDLSRNRVALYMECPCFFYKTVRWVELRLDSLPFTLNN